MSAISKKRATIVALILALSVASVGLAAAMMIPTAEELLVKSIEAIETVTDGHAVVDITVDMPAEFSGQSFSGQSVSGTFEVWGKLSQESDGHPSLRLEVLDASKPEMIGLTAVSDGNQFWLYDSNRNSVVTGTAEEMAPLLAEKFAEYQIDPNHGGSFDPESANVPQTPAEAVTKLLEHFTAERMGLERVNGTAATLLRLVPIPEKMPDEIRAAGGFIYLWLDANNQFPLAAEYAESALGYAKFETSSLTTNTGLDDELFTFTVPEGATVLQAADLLAFVKEKQQANLPEDFEALTPANLPEAAVAGEKQKMAGALIQRYELPGGHSFFVAQGPELPLDPPAEATSRETVTVRGVEATMFINDAGDRTLLAWREKDAFFIVGGDLTAEQATAVAQSLK